MSNYFSDVEFIESARVAQQGAKDKTEIATALAEVGYTVEVIAEGEALTQTAITCYETNFREDNETRSSYKTFSNLKNELVQLFRADRKKARIVFRKDPVTLQNLDIHKPEPRVYVDWLQNMKKFYEVAVADASIQFALARLKVTVEGLTANQAKISELEAARVDYLQEEGESQQATKEKDAAIEALSDWMSDFKAVAKIALEDKPQLLESLGIFVRS